MPGRFSSACFHAARPLLAVALALGGVASAPAADPVKLMEAFHVSAARVNAADTTGAGAVDTYDPTQIGDTGAFTVDEFLATLPPTEGKTLVLVDGVPTYLDISSLPLDMIAGIEVSRDGAMPQYGAYSSGMVINIRLKKDYVGGSAMGRIGGSLAGGAGQRSLMLSGAANRGALHAVVSLKLDRTDRLSAAARALSAEQDHTARGGHDLRVAWGSPATVVAVNGPLAGVHDATGAPVSSALVPTGQNGTALTPADFPGGGERRFNTAPYLSIAAPGTRAAANLGLTYRLAARVTVSLEASAMERRSDRIGPPPVTAPSGATLVPAALNPFGQDVEIGMVHVEFGPTHQATVARSAQAGLRFNGQLGRDWRWNLGGGFRHIENDQRATDLDLAKFTAALQTADPARRFNPFGDPAAGPVNASLYPALTVVRTRDDATNGRSVDAGANGSVLQAWGGPAILSLHGSWHDQERDRVSTNAASGQPAAVTQQSSSIAGSIGATLPLVGHDNAHTGFHRLELQSSMQWEHQSDDSGSHEHDIGLVWSPITAVYLRARYATQADTPQHSQIIATDSLVPEILLDPRRPNSPATDVRLVTRDTVVAAAERTDRASVGLGLEPTWPKGLKLSVDYTSRRQTNLLEDNFDPQDIIDNEATFPGRVLRAAASAADLAAGQPGQILSVDTTPGNAGRREQQDLHFSANYMAVSPAYGRIQIGSWAVHPLKSRYEVQPGVAFIHNSIRGSTPPPWRAHGYVAWSRQAWNAGATLRYTAATPADPGQNNAIAADTEVDVRLGYQFGRRSGRPSGRGPRVAVEVGNVFDAQPHWADTVAGYRGGSLLGRTYEITISVPL